jgi:FO synthase
VPYKTPLGQSRGIREMVAKEDAFLLYSVARLFFGRLIPNVQVSWCKLGLEAAVESFGYGVNDLGGTLLSENITRLAGGRYGQALTVDEMAAAIRGAGKVAVRRDTLYRYIDAAVATSHP